MSDLNPLFISNLLKPVFLEYAFRNWQNTTECEFCTSSVCVVCRFVCKIYSHFQSGYCYGSCISEHHMEGAHSVIAAFAQLERGG